MDITYATQHRPKYPPEAIRARHEGKVFVMAQIGVNGQVTETKIELSSGYPELDDSAVSTVSGWKFRPAFKDGAPVASWARVPVSFSLPKATIQP
jgi:TonB family C-terminal domain